MSKLSIKSKVLLRFYSEFNLGDDLFAMIISRRYKNTRFIASSPKIPTGLDNIYTPSKIYFLASKIIGRIFGYHLLLIRLLSFQSKLHLYVGGSIFIESGNYRQWQHEEKLYRNMRTPYYILGSNFGPYKDSSFIPLVSNIIRGAQDVCFRDTVSYESFKDIPSSRLATDLAFTLDPSQYDVKNEKIAVFSLIDVSHRFTPDISNSYDRSIIELTSQFIEKGYEVVYMSFCAREGDEIACNRIYGSLNDAQRSGVSIHKYVGNLDESIGLLARSEYIIASRFHGTILGLVFEKKVLPMAYSAKTINILNDIDYTGPIIDINNMRNFNGSTFNLSSLKKQDVSTQKTIAQKQFYKLDRALESSGKNV